MMSKALQSLNILFYKQAWTSESKQELFHGPLWCFPNAPRVDVGPNSSHRTHASYKCKSGCESSRPPGCSGRNQKDELQPRWLALEEQILLDQRLDHQKRGPARCHHSPLQYSPRPEPSVGRLRRHNVRKRKNLMKGGKAYVLVEQYLLSKTIDRSGWTAIQRRACQACHEQP